MADTKYYIFNKEVSKATFDKYANNRYEIGGVQRDMRGVALWATSREIAENCPEEAAQAKQIYDQILSEIGHSTPKKRTFLSFLDDLQTIYRDEMGKRNSAKKVLDIAEADYKATMEDHSAPEHIKLIARGDLEKARLAYKQQLETVQDSYKTRSENLRKQMEDFATELYRATPEKIDQSAIQLLSMGIMTADEMNSMADKYAHNPPMMRAIGHFAEKAGKEIEARNPDKAREYTRLAGMLKSVSDTSNAMSGFDSMLQFGMQGINGDDIVAGVRERNWERMYSSASDAYTNFIVQPAGSTET